MEFFIFIIGSMAIATVLIIAWFYGSVFACVFLSLPCVVALLLAAATHDPEVAGPAGLFGLFGLLIIWTPFAVRRMPESTAPQAPSAWAVAAAAEIEREEIYRQARARLAHGR